MTVGDVVVIQTPPGGVPWRTDLVGELGVIESEPARGLVFDVRFAEREAEGPDRFLFLAEELEVVGDVR